MPESNAKTDPHIVLFQKERLATGKTAHEKGARPPYSMIAEAKTPIR